MEVTNNEEVKKEVVEKVDNEINNKIETKEKNINKNKGIWIFFSIVLAALLIYAFFIGYKKYTSHICKKEVIQIKNIEISVIEEQIEVNDSIEITTIIEPSNYNIANMQWISSNPECLIVENNIVTAIGEGESSIYVINDNGVKSNEIVIKSIVGIEEIIIEKEFVEIEIGRSENLVVTILPENATNKNLIYDTTDENIAKIDGNGKISGCNVGECIINISSSDRKIIKECTVKIKPIEVDSLTLDESNVTIGVGQEYLLYETVLPNNATYKNVTWTSSNESILTVKDGKIKAISEGEANVIITSKNNKKAVCEFVVKNDNPKGKIKYSKGTYNVRSGPNTNYLKVGSVSKNEEIEILKVYTKWTKVRISSGIVGYMVAEGYSSSKSYNISNVPFLNQFTLGYPTGCEAVSATMAAKYAGHNVSVEQIIATTPTDEKGKREETINVEIKEEQMNEVTGVVEIVTKTEEQKEWYGGNPFKVFVGHPSKKLSAGSYGCFAEPIVVALKKCGISATNISGCSINTVFNYIEKGKPVVVWCKKNAGDLTQGVTWKYEDGSGSYTELVGEHCAVLIGYDADYVYLNDPAAGKNVKQPKEKFISNWEKLFSQAIVIN